MVANRSDCKTPGAFGKPKNHKPLLVRQLTPPPEIQYDLIDKDKKRPHSNKVVRFVKKFFGEGF